MIEDANAIIEMTEKEVFIDKMKLLEEAIELNKIVSKAKSSTYTKK
jgi:hypothetical protein